MTPRAAARIVLLALALAATAATVSHLASPRARGRLVVAAYALNREFLHLSRTGVAECLVRTDFAFGPPEPELAESWSDDGAGRWAFRLRRGVWFHDGQPLAAPAAAASIERWLESPEGAAVRGLFSARALGPDLVEVVASSPTLPVPDYLGRIPVLAPGSWDAQGRVVRPAGTGPFAEEAYAPEERASLVANRRWWGGVPACDGIEVRVVKDPSTRVAMLESGEADWVQMLSRHEADRLARAGHQVVETAYIYNVYLLFRCGRGPAADPAVRRAAGLAVDRGRLARVAFLGGADPAHGVFPPGHPLAAPAPPDGGFDPAEAERTLDAAGWSREAPDGVRRRAGMALELPLLTVADTYRPAWGTAAELLRQDLAKIGIAARVEVLERGAWAARVDGGDFTATLRGRVPGWWPDPAGVLRTDFRTGGVNNASRFSDAAFDRAVDEAFEASTPASREGALRKALLVLAEQAPVVPLVHDRSRELCAARKGLLHAQDAFSRRNAFPGPRAR